VCDRSKKSRLWAAFLLQIVGHPLLVIPAKAGLRRQDAGANIRAANGPKGAPQERREIHFLSLFQRKCNMDSRFRGNDVFLLKLDIASPTPIRSDAVLRSVSYAFDAFDRTR